MKLWHIFYIGYDTIRSWYIGTDVTYPTFSYLIWECLQCAGFFLFYTDCLMVTVSRCLTVRTGFWFYEIRYNLQHYDNSIILTTMSSLLGCYAVQIGSYRCFGTTCQSHVPSSRVKKGLMCHLETSITNYPSTLCNIPEERRSHLHHSRSLKSYNVYPNCLWPTIVW